MKIPFNKPTLTAKEAETLMEALRSGHYSGNGPATKRCQKLIEDSFGVTKALLTTSCTDALEMTAILIGIEPGDKVVLPSYTFSSTANAFCLRGALPVFVDIRKDTLNIDETKIEASVTPGVKAIVPVHYGGVSAEMDVINDIASRHGCVVVEDAAQGVNATYKGRYLGSLSPLATYSFHETKNYQCGEGGALLINDASYIEHAEMVWEKGTDRSKVLIGARQKYMWTTLGSSFLLSDILAALLYQQLSVKDTIQLKRKRVYDRYREGLSRFVELGDMQMPLVPEHCSINYHSFCILLNDEKTRDRFLAEMKQRQVAAYIGYVPLHLSEMGRRYGYGSGTLPVTEDVAARIVRLPFYTDMDEAEQSYAIEAIHEVMSIGSLA